MSDSYLGEIRLFSFGFAPRGWAQCNGQILPINQNAAVFSILGTTYGGNGQTTFALPNLNGRVPVHPGQGIMLGQLGGESSHTLSISEIPSHTHIANAKTAAASSAEPTNQLWASLPVSGYSNAAPNVSMNSQALTVIGGSQPHENMQPYTVLYFCICLQGIFPSRG